MRLIGRLRQTFGVVDGDQRRCFVCRDWFPRAEVEERSGLVFLCSDECRERYAELSAW